MSIEIELTPMEWEAMYGFCREYVVNLNSHINHLLLYEWAEGIQPNTLWKWYRRPRRRSYKVKLTASMAVAFWQEAQVNHITPQAQSALNKIDQKLKNEGLQR